VAEQLPHAQPLPEGMQLLPPTAQASSDFFYNAGGPRSPADSGIIINHSSMT
jgi:hypothetical protein